MEHLTMLYLAFVALFAARVLAVRLMYRKAASINGWVAVGYYQNMLVAVLMFWVWTDHKKFRKRDFDKYIMSKL